MAMHTGVRGPGHLTRKLADDGTTPTPPEDNPSLDFSDADNSQYVALLFEDF